MAATSRARICDLPDEVLLHIFSSLPVADLAQCAATCERWHDIVTGFTHLWKNKSYRSIRSPRRCAETHAVLHALPSLLKVTIESGNGFVVSVSYPYLVLSENTVRVMRRCPRLRCEFLSTRVQIAGDIMLYQSTIDLEGLQQLSIMQTWTPNFWAPKNYSTDHVVYMAMKLCPNLRRLSIATIFFTAENLDAVQELGQLQALEIHCPNLHKLSFLRHCSGALEGLQLLGCSGLPSRELAQLATLRNLRRLWLSYCRFQEGDLAAAVAGLPSLEALQLECCSLIHNLAIFQHCGRLRKLCINYSARPERQVNVAPGEQPFHLHDLQLPTNTANHWADVVGITVTGNDLSAALSRLEDLGLNSTCRVYLSAMHPCSQLRHLSYEFVCRNNGLNMLTVRIHITLTGST